MPRLRARGVHDNQLARHERKHDTMIDDEPADDAMEREFWENPPPPEGVIPQGLGPTEYSYVEDGEVIHGVANGVQTHNQDGTR
jgi:hypothetical protein